MDHNDDSKAATLHGQSLENRAIMASAMDWITLAATLGGMLFGAGIAWGIATAERAATRRRIDGIDARINRLEDRLDARINGQHDSKH